MTPKEYEVYQSEKRLAFLTGLITGITLTLITCVIIYYLKFYA